MAAFFASDHYGVAEPASLAAFVDAYLPGQQNAKEMMFDYARRELADAGYVWSEERERFERDGFWAIAVMLGRSGCAVFVTWDGFKVADKEKTKGTFYFSRQWKKKGDTTFRSGVQAGSTKVGCPLVCGF